ncbi:MAG: serine/threonine protein kinase [Verrucomicrobiae bacterium]|nr:serine/threonine protein kinase [Verrucomicrobiae bacterium]
MNSSNVIHWVVTLPLVGLAVIAFLAVAAIALFPLVRRLFQARTTSSNRQTIRLEPPTEPAPAVPPSGVSHCPRCWSALAPGVAQGLCPQCVLAAGFETQADQSPGGESRSEASAVPGVAELARHFPQLEILGLLGRGGMGWVFKARQKNLDRFVALKVLPPEVGKDPAFAERFQREARALARLNHPNIVAIYDFGRAGPYYFFVMEFVDGANLRELERSRRLSPEEAFAVVPKICEALQYAHEEGIVHRDIKPENILLDAKGRVKIADFGIAKLVGRKEDITLTGSRSLLGTPHYMAPEQVETPNKVDHRADIYALGVVFYEMLTGELPMGRFEPPSKKLQVDVRVDEVVLKSLERDPERRYQTVSAVKTDLENLSQGGAAVSPSAGGAPSPTATGSRAGALSYVSQAWRDWWAERAKWFAIAVQTLLVIGHFVCLFTFFNTSIKNDWESGGKRQFTYTVGTADPWYRFETYPQPHTPFRSGLYLLSSSMLFPVAGFALYYAFWRIEKARKPKAGWWSSPAPLAIGWALWAITAVGLGNWFGHNALKENQVGGGLLAPELRAAMDIRGVEDRDDALRKMALLAAPAGDVAAVIRAVEGIRANELRDQTAADCALELAQLNKIADATAVAQKIRTSSLHDTILERIASGSVGR